MVVDPNTVWDILQYANNAVVFVMSLLPHMTILFGVIYYNSSLNQYQHLIITQSTIDAIAITFCFLANKRISLNGAFVLGHVFLSFKRWEGRYLLFVEYMMESLEASIIAVFNIHRALIFLRPSYIRRFYALVTPCIIAFSLFDAYQKAFMLFGPDLSYCFTYLPFFIALGVAITCYFLLKTYFKTYGCSDKVRVLQSKLTTGLLLQILVHIAVLLLSIMSYPLFVTVQAASNKQTALTVVTYYRIVSDMIASWNTVFTAFVLRWSIAGFLKDRRRSSEASTKGILISSSVISSSDIDQRRVSYHT
ncbi:unnamed protein product [Heligmosomoides polygyrus]|uniref:G_PROTEIN_RECEP_F1_2 domain-containing protein n=1 Tax=Heligmosomoides polygyrus TaxID=6339 RepID=A0A3P7YW47_HELPZ|nr:unnamed protein product [Heligmosomoides polygyrus]